MWTSKKLFLGGAILILGGSALAWFFNRSNHGHWEKPHRGSITEAIYGLATLESDDTFRYRPAVTSLVKRVLVKEGQPVKKGDLLLTLGEGPAIRTPISGVVTELPAREKETCFPNVPLITVMNLKDLELSITLEQASALRVKPAQKVRVQLEGMKGAPLTGLVRTIYPKEGQFTIRVRLDPNDRLGNALPGMTADTAIEVGEKADALLIPLRALNQGTLLIRRGGRKLKSKPDTGLQSSEFIEVIPSASSPLGLEDEIWVSGP